MTQTCFASYRNTLLTTALSLTLGLFCLSTKAAFTDDLDGLLAELQSRAVALSNSTDKVEQKQFKSVVKAIKAINKPADSLADDLKTAGKVTKSLLKAFPTEFPTNFAGLATVTFTNNLADLLTNVFNDIQSDITNALDQLQTTVNALPAGNAKTKAQAAITQAQAALALANSSPDFKTFFHALGVALKSISKGQKAATSGGGGGGGGGSRSVTATVTINSVNDNWVADVTSNPDFPTAEWVQSLGLLDITGGRMTPGSSLSVSLCSGFTGQTGTYPLGGCGSFIVNSPSKVYSITSGTLIISTFNTSTHVLVATFNFTASDGATTITVSNGQANVPLIINP